AVFDDAKSKGYVGIPAIVYEDASIELDWEKYLEDQGIAVVSCDQESQEFPASCDISGKGC
ncbi:MAG: glutaredoxin, partial [Lachnospiraceae bacterium]|nr:glutaredoxin [Lachnospiraceae bacterium]